MTKRSERQPKSALIEQRRTGDDNKYGVAICDCSVDRILAA